MHSIGGRDRAGGMGWTFTGSCPGGGEIYRTRPERPRVPLCLLHNGYRVSPGGKAAGTWRLGLRSKKEYSYTSTHPLGHHGLL